MINLQDLIKEAYEYPDFQAITEFFIDPMSINSLRKKGDNPQIVGLTKTSQTGVLEMMSTLADGTTPGDFSKTGILHAYRQIAADELETLRAGGRLNDLPPRIVSFSYLVKLSNGQREWRDGWITIDIKDVPPSNGVFFGDRPLDNPGYSEMKLGGTVAIGSKGLDAYKVEQRLKYLGYSTFNSPYNANYSLPTTANPRNLREFEVNGMFGVEENTALRAFRAITHLDKTPASSNLPPNSGRRDYLWGHRRCPCHKWCRQSCLAQCLQRATLDEHLHLHWYPYQHQETDCGQFQGWDKCQL